ncbi:hypothetical protein CcI49_25550 [Frankia sp. CcI49]|uniref:EthD family reductase n=1 Tax=unclassified Frankia TaxID=2632575 RepID=UPI0006CA374F|nr:MULTISPECIES: EthD family reductase [unclassified Frankia]KPM52762.1 hypothetical protein ACG83_25205 [Frankia sp. R43]ONH57811.1 hypothetical protein CcI49_25550 [Frankia sp. CcI49]
MPQARLSVFYPAGADETFDHDYYRDVHIPLCEKLWKPADVRVDRGASGPHVAAVHITFSSREALDTALASEATAQITGDVKNYTTIVPVLQISDVVV